MATVTTVLLPVGGKATALLSYQIAEDSSAPNCAPSIQLQRSGDLSESASQASLLLDALPIDAAAAEGFAVSLPDYEGPDSEFGAIRQPGYAILDGLRAAERFAPLALHGVRTPVGIWGYSGGSNASGWAAQVQPSYAPELNIRGVALGGFVANLAQTFRQLNGGAGGGLLPALLPGLLRSDPTLNTLFDRYLTSQGHAALAKAGGQCILSSLAGALTNMNSYMTIPFDQFLALPSVVAALNRHDLGGTAPTAPLFVYHAVNDELVPIAGPDAAVRSYCAHGGAVTYTRDLLSEHGSLGVLGAPAALYWLTQQLDGASTHHGCVINTGSVVLSAGSLEELPQFLSSGLQSLVPLSVGPLAGQL
jgi:hypothetical protein